MNYNSHTWAHVLQQNSMIFSPRSSLAATLSQSINLLVTQKWYPHTSPLFTNVKDVLEVIISIVSDATIPETIVNSLSEIVSSFSNLVITLCQRLSNFETWIRLSSSFILVSRDVLHCLSPIIHSYSSSTHNMFQAQKLKGIFDVIQASIWKVERADTQLYELVLFCKMVQNLGQIQHPNTTSAPVFPSLPPLLAQANIDYSHKLSTIIENEDSEHITHNPSEIVHQFGHSHEHETKTSTDTTGSLQSSSNGHHGHNHAHETHASGHDHHDHYHSETPVDTAAIQAQSKSNPVFQFFEAVISYVDQVIIFKDKLGYPSSNIIVSDISYIITDVAACLRSQSRFSESYLFFNLALTYRSKNKTSSPVDIANSYNNCAICLHDQGACHQAEILYRKSLTYLDKHHGSSFKAAIARTMTNLAHCLHDQGKCAEAESFFHKSLSQRTALYGTEHHETLKTLEDLGNCLLEQRNYVGASDYLKKVVDIRQKILPPDHPILAHSLEIYAECLKNQQKHAEAIPLLLNALSIKRKHIPGDHHEIAEDLNNLGLEYHIIGNFTEAVGYYKASLEIRQRINPLVHLDVGNSMNNLASAYSALGKFEQAQSLYVSSLSIRQKLLPPNHHEIANSLSNLALCKHDLGYCEEAEDLFKQALDIYCSSCETEVTSHDHNHHPDSDVAQCLYNIANCYFEKESYGEAIPHYQKALNMFTLLEPAHSTEIASCKSNLGFCSFYQLEKLNNSQDSGNLVELPCDSPDDALAMMRQALEEVKEHNPSSLLVSRLYGNLAFCLTKSNPDQAKEHYNHAIDIIKSLPSQSESSVAAVTSALQNFQSALENLP